MAMLESVQVVSQNPRLVGLLSLELNATIQTVKKMINCLPSSYQAKSQQKEQKKHELSH